VLTKLLRFDLLLKRLLLGLVGLLLKLRLRLLVLRRLQLGLLDLLVDLLLLFVKNACNFSVLVILNLVEFFFELLHFVFSFFFNLSRLIRQFLELFLELGLLSGRGSLVGNLLDSVGTLLLSTNFRQSLVCLHDFKSDFRFLGSILFMDDLLLQFRLLVGGLGHTLLTAIVSLFIL